MTAPPVQFSDTCNLAGCAAPAEFALRIRAWAKGNPVWWRLSHNSVTAWPGLVCCAGHRPAILKAGEALAAQMAGRANAGLRVLARAPADWQAADIDAVPLADARRACGHG